MSERPNPYSNVCKLSVSIPWELAGVLIPILGQLLTELTDGVALHQREESRRAASQAAVDQACNENKLRWAAMPGGGRAHEDRRGQDR